MRGDLPQIDDADGSVARWDLNDGFVLHGFRVDGVGWLTVPGVAGYRFEPADPVEAVADGGSPDEIEDMWLRSVMPLVIQARGTQVLHASAFMTPRGVVALCGESTAGKSTLAAALMTRGYEVVADDALAFDAGRAHPLPFRLRLRDGSPAALGLPELAAQGSGGSPAALVEVVLLEPDDAAGRAIAASVDGADAVGRLMPHAYCFALDEGKDQLVAAYLELVRLVPVQRLAYPQTLDRLDETVDLLEDVVG